MIIFKENQDKIYISKHKIIKSEYMIKNMLLLKYLKIIMILMILKIKISNILKMVVMNI